MSGGTANQLVVSGGRHGVRLAERQRTGVHAGGRAFDGSLCASARFEDGQFMDSLNCHLCCYFPKLNNQSGVGSCRIFDPISPSK